MTPLRLVVFDATDNGWWLGRVTGAPDDGPGGSRRTVGLSPVWRAGAALHALARRADGRLGASSWAEALTWAAGESERTGRRIASLQVWGHGGWGRMLLGRTALDRDAFAAGAALGPAIDRLRDAFAGPDALVWLRCCSAFGHHGRDFARAAADRLGCRVAGHTHVIGALQSGTHSVGPGERPGWDPAEGVRYERGVAAGALGSSPTAPNTISCLRVDLPAGF